MSDELTTGLARLSVTVEAVIKDSEATINVTNERTYLVARLLRDVVQFHLRGGPNRHLADRWLDDLYFEDIRITGDDCLRFRGIIYWGRWSNIAGAITRVRINGYLALDARFPESLGYEVQIHSGKTTWIVAAGGLVHRGAKSTKAD